MRVILALTLLHLVACDASSPAPQLGARWDSYRFPVTLGVSRELTDCERAAVHGALAWWQAREGRELAETVMMEANDHRLAIPPLGVIAVTNGPQVIEGAEGSGWVHKDDAGKRLHSVEVRIHGCNARTVAHELGHAFGYAHAPGEGWLMSRDATDRSWRHEPRIGVD